MWKCAILIAVAAGCAFAEQPADSLAQGIAFLQKGEFQQSLPLLKNAVEQDSKSAPAHNYYGFALARTGALTQAVQEFKRSLAIDPHYPDALYNLGTALEIQGQYAAAVQNLQT